MVILKLIDKGVPGRYTFSATPNSLSDSPVEPSLMSESNDKEESDYVPGLSLSWPVKVDRSYSGFLISFPFVLSDPYYVVG